MTFWIILLPLLLSACTTPLPTSDRIELVRKKRLSTLSQEIKLAGYQIGVPLAINIYKEERILEIWMKRPSEVGLYKTYPICNYSGTLGPKLREGDLQAPEGFYKITAQDLNPRSKYHLSMNIGYPNAWDTAHGLTGSYIMIHGDCQSKGCYAMGDGAIEDIYLIAEQAFKNGQEEIPVNIYPFRMTPENFERHKDSPWIGFWAMLARGGYQ